MPRDQKTCPAYEKHQRVLIGTEADMMNILIIFVT